MSLFQVLKGCFFAFFFSILIKCSISDSFLYIWALFKYSIFDSLLHFTQLFHPYILWTKIVKKKIKNMSFGFHPLNSFSIPVQYVSYWDFQIVSISCYSISWESARTWIRIWIYSMEYVRPGFLSTKHTQDISL